MTSKYGNIIVHCEIDGQAYRFRSRMEHKYALYLEFLRLNGDIWMWQYEPETFTWLNSKGNRISYKPDFKILVVKGHSPCGMIECSRAWVEVKGYLDSRSKAKLKGFAKHYPSEKLVLVDSKWFRQNGKKLKGLVKGWT